MSQPMFMAAFFVVWVCALVYVVSVWRLAQAVRRMKADGSGKDAPDIIFNLPGGVPGLVWLVMGRYPSLGDPGVTRWAQLARLLLFIVFPMMLALFAIAATTVLS
ncbi:MAG: hypothetical protein ABMA14_03500 [Hyphomonadaceae bacterium]